MHFLVDENISFRVAERLTANGYKATHVRDSHLKGRGDTEIVKYAKRNSFILITLDKDFANIIHFPPRHYAGIIWLKLTNPTVHRIGNVLLSLLPKLKGMSLSGKLVVCDEQYFRIH